MSEAFTRMLSDRPATGIPATRAMVKWGFPIDSIDDDNLVVAEWEALIERAAR
jgi:hypothetical protein